MLDAAAVGGSVDVMSALLEAGAQQEVVNVVSVVSARSALYTATVCGHEGAARKLVLVGGDANFVDPVDKCSVLHRAIRGGHEELANYLLMSGACVNSRDNRRASPLHVAAVEGHTGVVSTLLQKGAEKDALDNLSESPLAKASRNGHLAVVKTLLAAGADINIRSMWRVGLLYRASSALDWAARKGHVDILKAIVGHGADVDSTDADGVTALHNAAISGQADAIHELIEAGADVDHMNRRGLTPLFSACCLGNLEAAVTLLRRGAALNAAVARSGTTVLHAACLVVRFIKVDLEATVDLLLRWGANETALDHGGRTPEEVLDPREISSGFPANDRDSIEDMCRRARLLMMRAPIDRAWRRRCWLIMLRSRASTDRNGRPDDGGGIGVIGSNAGSNRERSCKARTGGSGGGVSADTQSCNNGVMGESAPGGGDRRFGNVVALVVGLELEGVFRNIVGFL